MSNQTATKKSSTVASKADEALKKADATEKKISKDQLLKDVADYKLFAFLHLAQRNENGVDKKRIKASSLKEYEMLEKRFRNYEGKKALKNANVFLGLGMGTCKIAEGYAVPQPIYDQFVENGIEKYWFG